MILFILSFVLSAAHADSQKFWIVPDSTDSSKLAIVGAGGFTPPGAIIEAPLDEKGEPYPVEVVEIVEEPDPFGPEMRKVARVNKQRLADRLKKEDDARKAQEMQDAINKAGRLSRMNRIRSQCSSATGLMKDLCEYVIDN
jgi:hypothetical protein